MKIPYIKSEWCVLFRPQIDEKYCGWLNYGTPNECCVSIAELDFKEI